MPSKLMEISADQMKQQTLCVHDAAAVFMDHHTALAKMAAPAGPMHWTRAVWIPQKSNSSTKKKKKIQNHYGRQN